VAPDQRGNSAAQERSPARCNLTCDKDMMSAPGGDSRVWSRQLEQRHRIDAATALQADREQILPQVAQHHPAF